LGKLKRILLVLGILLLFYPICHRRATEWKQNKMIEQHRSGLSSNEMIGILEIPAIQVLLPVYDGVTEGVLQKGIGHLEMSSPLGGGSGTHCLLAGHRGLPEAELLARLGELEEGDLFRIEIDDKTYTYQVCEIRVLKPEETEGLGIQKDRDLVSLITCTPYGINTHRLVVTGERLEEEK